jgi:hypothetical protein
MMVNESQVIADINNSPDLSKKTRIAMHPWVEDADAELKQIKQEQEEAIDQYAGAFPQNPIEEDGGISDEE